MTNGVAKGCGLSLLALAISLLLTFLLLVIFTYLKLPFGWAFIHGGGPILVWWLIFFPVYGILLKMYSLRQKRSQNR